MNTNRKKDIAIYSLQPLRLLDVVQDKEKIAIWLWFKKFIAARIKRNDLTFERFEVLESRPMKYNFERDWMR